MEKKVLVIGMGNCGSKIVDELFKINPLFPHIYAVNTNPKELAAVSVPNKINIGELNGSGGNRQICLSMLKKKNEYDRYFSPILDVLKSEKISICIMVSSTGGGTGSALLEFTSSFLQSEMPDVGYIIFGITPLESEINCWESTNELFNGLSEIGYLKYDALSLIKNFRDDNGTFEILNKNVANSINNIFTDQKKSIDDDLDSEDIRMNIKNSGGLIKIESTNYIDNINNNDYLNTESASEIIVISCNEKINTEEYSKVSNEKNIRFFNYSSKKVSEKWVVKIFFDVDKTSKLDEFLSKKRVAKKDIVIGVKSDSNKEDDVPKRKKVSFNWED